MLKLVDVRSGYGEVEIIHEVSATFKKNSICAIVGPNGSGKSTLLRSIMGSIDIKGGKVLKDEEDITDFGPPETLRKGVTMIPQGRVIFPELSVKENLIMGGYSLENSELVEERIENILQKFEVLKEKEDKPAKTLSGGEQTMLCLGRSLVLQPDYFLLDEPSLGLAPQKVEEVYDMIQELFETQNVGIVLVEQNVRKALHVAEKALVINLGEKEFEGDAKKVRSDEKLCDLYLGLRE